MAAGSGHSCPPPPPFVRSSLQCSLHPSLDQALEHRFKLGSGSDSPRATRAPTSSFFTGVDGECEGIICKDRLMEAGEEQTCSTLHPSQPRPSIHLVQVMATNEATGIQVEGGKGIKGPGKGRERCSEGGKLSEGLTLKYLLKWVPSLPCVRSSGKLLYLRQYFGT